MLKIAFRKFGVYLMISFLALMLPSKSYSDDFTTAYRVRNLVSNIPGKADNTDADLVNAWGIAFNPDGVVWVNDNGTGKSTLYDGNGVKIPLVVTIPGPSSGEASKPTGIVFFGGRNDFIINGNPSRFIFATENGTVSGWAPGPLPPVPTSSVEMINNSAGGTIYKGLALSTDGKRYLLYATDFHNNKVDVFDGKFQPVTLSGRAFTDPNIPNGFAPFGIQAIDGVIFVSYAQQDEDQEDDVQGSGLGFVNAFDSTGKFLQRIATRGKLNAPWGIALAPANFGEFSNRLLIGNFGDGTIVAYDFKRHGDYLRVGDGRNLKIPGLWGLSFGNGLQNQPTNDLFFTAGPDDENNGRYGKIEAVSILKNH